jgi:LCP family protein required for cell wall assembly
MFAGAFCGGVFRFLLALTPLQQKLSAFHLPNSPARLTTDLPATLTRPVNLLILGIDNSGHPHSGVNFNRNEALAGNSDTMLLVRLLPETHQINVLSIPRDTLVQMPQVGIDKINDANVRGGAQLAAQSVSQLLGGIKIDRYLRVDTEGFIHLVDALGGVEINVPKQMDYVDRSQKLSIHLNPGSQVLNGQHLQEYVRFRHDALGDIGRVQRQQEVLKAIFSALLRPETLSKGTQILQVAKENIDTDLSVEEMIALFRVVLTSDRERSNFVMLPGRFSRSDEYTLSYWIVDPQAAVPILASYFDVPNSGVVEAAAAPSPRQLNVAVSSATGDINASRRVMAFLRKQGFTNVYMTDYDYAAGTSASSKTQIIAQHGNPEAANMVQQVLREGQVQVISTGDIYSDVTVILGHDSP